MGVLDVRPEAALDSVGRRAAYAAYAAYAEMESYDNASTTGPALIDSCRSAAGGLA